MKTIQLPSTITGQRSSAATENIQLLTGLVLLLTKTVLHPFVKMAATEEKKGRTCIFLLISNSADPFSKYISCCKLILHSILKQLPAQSQALAESLLDMAEEPGADNYQYWCDWFSKRKAYTEYVLFQKIVSSASFKKLAR